MQASVLGKQKAPRSNSRERHWETGLSRMIWASSLTSTPGGDSSLFSSPSQLDDGPVAWRCECTVRVMGA